MKSDHRCVKRFCIDRKNGKHQKHLASTATTGYDDQFFSDGACQAVLSSINFLKSRIKNAQNYAAQFVKRLYPTDVAQTS